MKSKNVFLLVLIFTLFCIAGCTTAVPYSFARDEKENGTATITFVGERDTGVDLHFFEDTELPYPSRNKYWAPVIFPAERPLTLKVNIYFSEFEVGYEKTIECPALTAGKDYKFALIIIPEKTFLFGLIKIRDRQEKLVLTEAKTKTVVYELPL